MATDYTKLPFVEARWYTKHEGPREIRFLVVHVIEGPESPTSAEACAIDFQTRKAYRILNGKRIDQRASAHFSIDSNSIVQSVQTKDIAWAARSVGNRYGVHLEHAGRAAQSASDWADDYSQAMLRLSAGLAAFLCQKFALPLQWLTPEALRHGERGITGHTQISQAWGGTHTDPGPNFPINWYLANVKAARNA